MTCSDLAEEDGVADVLGDLGVDVPEHGHPARVLALARPSAAAAAAVGRGGVVAGAEQDGGEDLGRRLRTLLHALRPQTTPRVTDGPNDYGMGSFWGKSCHSNY